MLVSNKMPIFGTITVEFDGFIKYLDCEITDKISVATKRLQETHTELQSILGVLNRAPNLTSLICCVPTIGRRLMRRHNTRAVADVGYIQASSRMEHRINEIQAELLIMTSRREFIRSPEFKEKVLGQCPICFDELVNKSETTIIPDCLHPVCHSCFDMIYHRQQGYKCPMCCANSLTFYEVWFCTVLGNNSTVHIE
jgi:hypothetical protein